MNRLDEKAVEELAAHGEAICVSLYAGTERISNPKEYRLRYKSLLSEAARRFREQGMEEAQTDEILKPARDFLDSGEFWEDRGNGLAVFAAPAFFRYLKLPLGVSDSIHIGNHFHITPLFEQLLLNEPFYVLALSIDRARLYRTDLQGMTEVPEAGLPEGIKEITRFIDEPDLTFRWGSHGVRARMGGNEAKFHGGGENEPDTRLKEYFRLVNNKVQAALRDSRRALVLACVAQYQSYYRDANTYPFLSDTIIEGSPDERGPQELHRLATEVRSAQVREELEKERRFIDNQRGDGRAESDPALVIPAACSGYLERLWVNRDAPLWGRYDRESMRILDPGERKPGTEDLCDLAAIQTLTHGGEVRTVPAEMLPEGAHFLALFRPGMRMYVEQALGSERRRQSA